MKEAGRNLWDLRTAVRDGVELSADVHFPPAGLGGGPYPLVLIRTADGNQHPTLVETARALAEAGFVAAIQDVRGRHDSEGSFTPFEHEGPDGYDTIEWLAAQKWCTGQVAMLGSGYGAWAARAAAAEEPRHLIAVVDATAPGDRFTPAPFQGGIPNLAMFAWLHAMGGRVWQEGSHVDWSSVFRHLPLSAMDRELGHELRVWHQWLASRFEAAPPATAKVPLVTLPAHGEQVRWLRDLFAGRAAPAPAVSAGRTSATYYLGGGRRLSEEPTGDAPPDSYVYDPLDPVVVAADFNF